MLSLEIFPLNLCIVLFVLSTCRIWSSSSSSKKTKTPSLSSMCFYSSQINVLQSKRRSEILKSVSGWEALSTTSNNFFIFSSLALQLITISSTDAVFHVCPLDVLSPRIWPLQWTTTSNETAWRAGTVQSINTTHTMNDVMHIFVNYTQVNLLSTPMFCDIMWLCYIITLFSSVIKQIFIT